MSLFTDRRSLRQIGGLRAYLHQVAWSLWWGIEWRRRQRTRRKAHSGAPSSQAPPRPATGIRPAEKPR